MKSDYEIRTMSRQDLGTAISWAASEGWNPGIFDSSCFYQIDPKGFFMGFLKDKPISCISAVSWSDNFAFMGLYIVRPQFRKKGYGIKIWDHAIKYLKSANIGLDAVKKQQENYQKSGFKLAYNNARYQIVSRKSSFQDLNIIPVSQIPLSQLIEYDKEFFPAERNLFLKCWVSQQESFSVVSMINNKIQGFGVIRKCHRGYKIGPLFADDQLIAQNLFMTLLNRIPDKSTVYLDIPEVNKMAVNMVNKYKMKKVFSTARMYTKTVPIAPIEKIFGITTFEVG